MKQSAVILASILLSVGISVRAEERTWTSSGGATLKAELVEVKGSTVVLRSGSKQITAEIKKLSPADREYLQQVQQAKEAEQAKQAMEKLSGLLGLRQEVPITERRWSKWQDYYFKSHFGKAMLDFFNTERSITDVVKRGLFVSAEQAVRPPDYAPSMTVYCPPTYDGKTKLGVYIHIQPTDSAMNPSEGYKRIMDEHRLVFASPNAAGNDQADMRRMALALDTLAQLRKDYPLDETRIYVGGLSGGGAESVFITLSYPDDFRGALDAVRGFDPFSDMCLPFAKPADIRKSAKYGQPLALITGAGDMNYEYIKKDVPNLKKSGFTAKLFDVPGMKHEAAPPAALEEALLWADANNPRFKPEP